jgi:hypothetical protein
MTIPSFSLRSIGPRWVRILAVVALACLVIAVVSGLRGPILRSAGWALVVDDPLEPADIIVVTVAASGAGLLEAADLVRRGISQRVAVFAEAPSALDLELLRRGIPFEPDSARSVRSLKTLGVPAVEEIPSAPDGSEGEAEAIADWSTQRQFRAIVVVSATDHSRRLRRLLHRSMKNHRITVMVRPSRRFGFDPDRWWETRGGIRTEIFELQKLLFDLVRHPLS